MLACLCTLSFAACGPKNSTPKSPLQSKARQLKAKQMERGDIIETALSQMGNKYRRGGTAPDNGFDCSGFMYWVFSQHGYELPRRAVAQSQVGEKVKRGELKPGDLVAFKIRTGYHTGLYIGGGKFVHSPRPGKSIEEADMNEAYWAKSFIGARRILQPGHEFDVSTIKDGPQS